MDPPGDHPDSLVAGLDGGRPGGIDCPRRTPLYEEGEMNSDFFVNARGGLSLGYLLSLAFSLRFLRALR